MTNQKIQTFGTVSFQITVQLNGVVEGKIQANRLKKIFEKAIEGLKIQENSEIIQTDLIVEVEESKTEILEFGYNP